MKIFADFKDGILTIHLCGAIDSSNSAAAETEIMEIYAAHEAQQIVLDAKELTYISSSGLRVLLKLRKLEKNMKLINASSEVYDILDMTGFVDMFPVSRALRSISIDNCIELGAGGHGRVLKLNGDTIVKLYHPGVSLEEVEREQNYAKRAFVMGIPTAIPFDVVTCGDQYGLVFELVDADTLTNFLTKHPEKMAEYAVKYGKMMKQLHEVHITDGALESCRELYRERIEGLRSYMEDEEVEMLHRINDAIPDGDTVVHGDFHPLNVMVQGEELTLIDMADLTTGHPLYDLGSMALTHHITNDARIEGITRLKASAVRELWQRFLVTYLGTEDPQVIELTIKKASVVALMKMASALSFSAGARVPGVMEGVVAMVRKNLLENAEQLIKLLSM